MTVFEAAFWGLLQGLTEFLPVSSSGHLVLVPWLLGRKAPGFTFDVAVHLATLLAVLIYFRHELLMLVRGTLTILTTRRLDTPEARLAGLVFLSSLPAVAAGVLLKSTVDRLFGSPPVVALLLIVTGAIMYAAEKSAGSRAIPDMGTKDAALIGLAQAAALAPGLSRSGLTISAGLGRRFTRPEAARYAFVMSIPVVLGAAAMEALDTLQTGLAGSWALIGVGMVVAFASGYFAIGVLLRHVARHGLRVFSVYCWVLGLGSLLVYALRQGVA